MKSKRVGLYFANAGLIALCFMLVGFAATSTVLADDNQPNIIVINLDDADLDLMSPGIIAQYFPTIDRLANEGTRFTNFHVTTPLCGPSRASTLRGQYAHRTGIKVNQSGLELANGFTGGLEEYQRRGHDQNDLSVWMQGLGYETALIGKYVNNGIPGYVPAGWEHFYCSLGSRYYATTRFTNQNSATGSLNELPGNVYRTNAEINDCLNLLESRWVEGETRPFFYYVAPLAPHIQADPDVPMYDTAFEDVWPDLTLPRTPDFDEADYSDKPEHYQHLPRLSASAIERADREYRSRMLSMISIDRMLAEILDKLAETGEHENTYIFLTSDNGYSLGHHRRFGKSEAYNRSTNVPLVVWGPNVVEGETANHLLANIDLAPTCVELAGGRPLGLVDGISFKTLVEDPQSVPAADWRHSILIENWSDRRLAGQQLDGSYVALRTLHEIYSEWSNGEREYYDLSTDPWQLENGIDTLPGSSSNVFQIAMRELKWNPQTAVTTISSSGQPVTQSNISINGIAEERWGVSRIRVAIRDAETQRYWNGSDWSDSFTATNVEPSRLGLQLGDWSFGIKSSDLETDYSRLVISARPFNLDNVPGSPAVARVIVDQAEPETTIRFPFQGAIVSGPVRIRGNAFDQSQVAELRLTIRDTESGLYFDGVNWSEERSHVSVPMKTRTFWEYNFDPPSGKYFISARAYDEAGNFDRSPQGVVVRFR